VFQQKDIVFAELDPHAVAEEPVDALLGCFGDVDQAHPLLLILLSIVWQ
jgi:hypothetical protein